MAVVHPITRGLKEIGNRVIAIIGARTKDLLILEKKMEAASHELHVCTDDGSYGHHGFVTDKLKEVLEKEDVKLVVGIGPVPMMKFVCKVTEEYGEKFYHPCGQVTIKAVVSGNTGSIFLPAVYKIENVKVLDGPQYGNVTEVVSYETLYDSLAENGETIQVKGKLEKITKKESSQQRYRVLVGSAEGKGKEYIKLLK